MNQLPLATNIFGLLSLVILCVGIWAQSRRNGNMSSDIKTQVTNGGTNLAMTVGEIKANLGELSKDFGEMRTEVAHLRREVNENRD